MAQNDFDVVILPNGDVRVTTGSFAGPVHMSADAFMIWIQRELGGEARVTRGHSHSHAHGHSHDHDHDHDHHHVKGRG